MVLIVLAYVGMLYLNENAGGFSSQVYAPYSSLDEVASAQSAGDEVAIQEPEDVVANCQVCHQPTGLGMPGQFPPLAGSEWVNAQAPNRIIRIVLNGAQGPITINGTPFATSAAMVAWRDILKDDDIAAVLTFVRGNKEWGNNAPAVTPQQVKAIRDKIKDNTQPFSPDADLSHLSDSDSISPQRVFLKTACW